MNMSQSYDAERERERKATDPGVLSHRAALAKLRRTVQRKGLSLTTGADLRRQLEDARQLTMFGE